MIDFSRAQLTHFIIHFVGNKGIGEELRLADKCIEFKDDFVKETALRYFLSPFKNDVYHQFKKALDVSIDSVVDSCETLYLSRKEFVAESAKMAKLLYNQSMHPKIKGGELYVCYFKDVVCDGELIDAVGIFKTERRETFLQVFEKDTAFEIDADNGIDITKLDKGCLVFNTDKKEGYKLSIIDTNNKVAECALYWSEDFLNTKIKTNAYYHTKNFIDVSRGFCEEILTEANNVSKEDMQAMLRKSVAYFKEREKLNLQEFEKEVLIEPEVVEAFEDYRKDFASRMDVKLADEFDVSLTAVKSNQKYMRTVVKLDKNFHVYIHGGTERFEKGFDEEKGLKFYKLYFVNEE